MYPVFPQFVLGGFVTLVPRRVAHLGSTNERRMRQTPISTVSSSASLSRRGKIDWNPFLSLLRANRIMEPEAASGPISNAFVRISSSS